MDLPLGMTNAQCRGWWGCSCGTNYGSVAKWPGAWRCVTSATNTEGIVYSNKDCEGHVLQMLKGCDLYLFRPYIIIVEAIQVETGETVKSHLQASGYKLKEFIYCTLLFARSAALASACS